MKLKPPAHIMPLMPVSAPYIFYTRARYSHHKYTVRVSVSRVPECSGHRQPDARGDLRRLLLRDAAPRLAVLQLPRLRPVRAPLDALAHVCARLVAADLHRAAGPGELALAVPLAPLPLALVAAA